MNITTMHLQQTGVKKNTHLEVMQWFNTYATHYDVQTPLRIAHLMAQICHECDGFRIRVENLKYTTPKRLMEVWPKRFPTEEKAKEYINNPEKLGNYVYANRLGNGPTDSGDGFRYRGRGPLQTTGKDWYRKISINVFSDERLVENPDLLMDLGIGLQAAFVEWDKGNCNILADEDNLKAITLKINGGTLGLKKRGAWLRKWKEAMGLVAPDQ